MEIMPLGNRFVDPNSLDNMAVGNRIKEPTSKSDLRTIEMSAMNDSRGLAGDITSNKKSRPMSSHSGSTKQRNSKGFNEFTTETVVTTTKKIIKTI